jgi:alpha-amylase
MYIAIVVIFINFVQILTDRFAKDTDDTSSCTDLKGYCGGTFNGIIQKLDYLEGLGINAIWISPIPEQSDNGYHGYWQKNLYNVNSHFGTSGDLHRLVQECHSRGIWVMLDVVGNHMGYHNQDMEDFYPFTQPEHYHSDCPLNDYNNQHEV